MTMQPPASLMLFAAGLGTRMRHLTTDRPKPLIKVAGEALIDHALRQVEGAGIARTVVNLHYRPEMLRAHLSGRNIAFSDETETILETGGGLKAALPLLGTDPVFTFNSDAVWSGTNPLNDLSAAWNPDQMDALLLLIAPDRARGHSGKGDFTLAGDGRITRGGPLIYSGAQIIKTDGLADISDQVFSLNVLWDRMLAGGRVHGLTYSGHWCDVGSPEGITAAEEMLREAPDV